MTDPREAAIQAGIRAWANEAFAECHPSWWETFNENAAFREFVEAYERAMWRPIEEAPKDATLLGEVDGEVRLIRWCKTSHVPMFGWNLVDQGPEDCDLCQPVRWQPVPALYTDQRGGSR